MRFWEEQLLPIINEYKDSNFEDGEQEPLDGDEVDRLVDIIRAKINLHEGNITEHEYNEILDNPTSTLAKVIEDKKVHLIFKEGCSCIDDEEISSTLDEVITEGIPACAECGEDYIHLRTVVQV